MKTKIVWLMAVFLALSITASMAQNTGGKGGGAKSGPGVIRGMVVDAQSKQGVEFASITITRAKDSSLVSGGVTDNKGAFQIDNLPFGRMVVKIKFIGYRQKKLPAITINPQNTELDLGQILLESAEANLKEVTVTAQKDMVSYNIDRKVFNVDRNIAAAGGTALDLMQNIPSVSVDVNGTVSLRGSENVTILMDGRPSGLTSLDQLPASMIQNIEVITNPSAKFDPDGMSGIINITLKRKDAKGYNGQLSVGAGTGNRSNAGINLNIRREKFNFTINYDFRHFGMNGTTETRNQQMYVPENIDSTSLQNNSSERQGSFHNIKLGTDWYINAKNTFSISGLFNKRKMEASDTSLNDYFSDPRYLTLYDRKRLGSSSNSGNNGYEFTASYKKTFDKKGEELTFDGFASVSDGNTDNTSLQNNMMLHPTPPMQNITTLANTQNKNSTYTLQSDYTLPISNGKFEAGIKGTFKNTDIDYLNQNLNYQTMSYDKVIGLSNHYVYDENYYAAYASLAKGIGKFKYQLGLRLERAHTESKVVNENRKFAKDYTDYFPTVHLQYQFSEANTLQLNYTKRINRPNTRVLNPAINNSDSLNISYGNPNLNPEYAHSFELGHSISFGKTSLTSTLFYRATDSLITRVTLREGNSKISTYQNLNSSTASGIEFVLNQDLTKWWKISANYSYFKSTLKGKAVLGPKESNSWTAKATSNMNLPLGIDFQLSFNYRSPVVSAGVGGRNSGGGGVGKTTEIYWLDAGMKRDFLKNKLSLTVRVSDLLRSQINKSYTYSDNFNAYSERRTNSRMLFVGLTYKINDFKRTRERQQEEMEEN